MKPAEQTETPTENAIGVLPPPDPVLVLQDENKTLRETNDLLTDQCQVYSAQVKVLMDQKEEILERLRGHEENSFACVMANLEGGDVLHNASDAIFRLAELVEERQEPGKIAITITMEPFKAGAQVAVAEIKVTEPKRDKKPSIFFVENGKITRQTQRQGQLDI